VIDPRKHFCHSADLALGNLYDPEEVNGPISSPVLSLWAYIHSNSLSGPLLLQCFIFDLEPSPARLAVPVAMNLAWAQDTWHAQADVCLWLGTRLFFPTLDAEVLG
jgi:hypothetical protein